VRVALAWQLGTRASDGATVVSKDGAWDAFTSFMAWVPATGVGVVVLSNSSTTSASDPGVRAIAQEILAALP
jgi:hypothetical protein